jgi:hypothetical protein
VNITENSNDARGIRALRNDDRLLISPPSKMALTHYLLNDFTPLDRVFDDVLSNRAYRQSQQLDVFQPR